MKRITSSEFKKRLIDIFGNKYDLSKVEYVNAKTKVTLTCPEHGDFSALPQNLLRHKGCPKCRYVASSSKMRCALKDVISLSNVKHNNKYDYSLITEYKNNKTKYPIICHEKYENGEEHGVFYQDFAHHIGRGHGCPRCSGNKKRTSESFITDANRVHDNRYDYSKVEYNGIHNKVCIICPIHGEFWQSPNDHLHGQGCPKCKGKKIWDKRGRLTVDEVKEQFKSVHGDKYDYSLFTEYKNNHTKIPIICKNHGVFYATPNSHISGRGCPECAKAKRGNIKRLSKEEINKRINELYGDLYELPDDFVYKDNSTPIRLICRKHGEFSTLPINLFVGHGCQICGKEKYHESRAKNVEKFIEEASEVHNNKYDYSKVEYKNNRTKVCIICPEHGEFWQTPYNHLNGQGCPKCNYSALERAAETMLKNNNIPFIPQYKLGRQKIDFFLPDYNIAIECQGEQHFINKFNFKGKEISNHTLDVVVDRDRRKYNKCLENKWDILYLTEENFVKDIELPEFYSKDNLCFSLDNLFEKIKKHGRIQTETIVIENIG